MSNTDLITATHRSRRALIYVRQSTPQQVLSNQESLRLQYALHQRALDLGWQAEDIEVIDKDLGLTAASAQHRAGFKDLLGRVTLGEIGMILAIEVTRLARNCSDWYPLLDLCGLTGCLIADRDGVYDPASANGRLLLGLKGQISELELHTIRARLTAGLLNKAQRGELVQSLPVGLVRDERGHVIKEPNEEVQERLHLVFTTFLRVRSASKVSATLDQQGVQLPRRDHFGAIVWRRPTVPAVLAILRNPSYAGAFVYGRRRSVRRTPTARRPVQRALPITEWRIRVPDKYPAYIEWPLYEKIQAMLDDNRSEYVRASTRGIPREGAALLHGLVYCGESGHKLTVVYRPQPQYHCSELRRRYGGPLCQVIPASPVDAQVVAAFFAALQPAELDLYAAVLRERHHALDQVMQAYAQQVQRLRYEVALAERQYRRVDPDNRLVAGELERRWEAALRALKEAEETQRTHSATVQGPEELDTTVLAALKDVGAHLPALWESGVLSHAQQKALLRCLIEKVVVHRPVHDRVRTRIVWRGGETTTFDVPVPIGAFTGLANAREMEEQILRLARAGCSDTEIAQTLTSQGYRSARHTLVLPSTVRLLRTKHRLLKPRPPSHPHRPAGHLTIRQIAAHLGVSEHWLYDRIYKGRIIVARDPETRLYLFPDHPATWAQLQQLKAGALQVVQLDKEHHHA